MNNSSSFLKVFDNLPTMIWHSNQDTKCDYFNHSWLAFTGRRIEQELGTGWEEGVHPEDLPQIASIYDSAFKARQSFQVEYRLRHESGEYRWVLDIGQPFYLPDGEFAGYIGSCFDLSERKKMEKAIQESEAMFKGLFEYAPDAVVVVDETGKILLANQQAQKMFHYSWIEMVGQNIDLLMPESFHRRHREHVGGYIHQPRVRPMGKHLSLYGKRKEGSLFPVDIMLGPLQINEKVFVLATIRDITDRQREETELRLYKDHLEEMVSARTTELEMEVNVRQQIEDALLESQERLKALAEISGVISETGLNEQALVNKVARFTASTFDSLCCLIFHSTYNSHPALNAIYHDDAAVQEQAREHLKNLTLKDDLNLFQAGVLESGVLFLEDILPADLKSIFNPAYTPLLERFPIRSMIAVPLRTQERILGYLIIARDHTQPPYSDEDLSFAAEVSERTATALTNAQLFRQVQTELKLRKKADAELQSYANQLARSNRDLQDFASIASHDLQEPLRKIQAFAERIRVKCEAVLDESGVDYLDRMQNAANRMQILLNDLLKFSRVNTRGQALQPVDLREVAADVTSDLEMRIEESQGSVEVGELLVVDADPSQMRQLFQNLIGNALKFHRQGVPPQVKVWGEPGQPSAGSSQPTVNIYVQDNGIGFDERYLERIFQPFQRLYGRNEYEGTGIGLAICRRIIERHQGNITAHSREGEGTTFIVTLPVHGSIKNLGDEFSDGGV